MSIPITEAGRGKMPGNGFCEPRSAFPFVGNGGFLILRGDRTSTIKDGLKDLLAK